VRIDYCGECHGIWLDKDQYPKIIESLEDELGNTTFSEYFHESIEEAKELFTGDKSFTSEWKDFSSVLNLMQSRLFVERPKLVETLRELYGLNPFK
jgi:Zn-finger nucleic acid-binding protein